jgi:YD repeat-containing protein
MANNLSGSCIGPQATGNVVGTVTGSAVRWRWQWTTYGNTSAAAFDFVGTLQPDNKITGILTRGETGLSLEFTATRSVPTMDQRAPTPDDVTVRPPVPGQRNDVTVRPPVPNQRDDVTVRPNVPGIGGTNNNAPVDRVTQQAWKMFPWAGSQAKEREAYILSTLAAARQRAAQ